MLFPKAKETKKLVREEATKSPPNENNSFTGW